MGIYGSLFCFLANGYVLDALPCFSFKGFGEKNGKTGVCVSLES